MLYTSTDSRDSTLDDLWATWLSVDVSNSEFKSWRHCRRQWWLSWLRCLRWRTPQFTTPGAIGTRIHDVLAAYYTPERHDDVDVCAYQAQLLADTRAQIMSLESTQPTEYVTSLLEDFDRSANIERIMLEGYLQWLEETGADADYEVISVETPIRQRIDIIEVNTYPNSGTPRATALAVNAVGILDACLRDIRFDSCLFLDHKTVADFGRLLNTVSLDTQILHYMLLEHSIKDLRRYTGGALLNMLRKVKRTARAKPPYYERALVHHNDIEVNSYRSQLLAGARNMVDAQLLLESGVNHHEVVYPSPCADCSWSCEFFTVCQMFNDSSAAEDMLRTHYMIWDPTERYSTSQKPVKNTGDTE